MPRQLKNATITHVSYVERAANKKRFLLTKSLDEDPTFQKQVNVIIDKSDEKKLVYGVVYEPDVEDAHGDYMTVDDIEKSAHDFMKDARNIDTNHDFDAGVGEVVESYIAPADFEIGDEKITKGTWVMVTKASDEIWEDIKKGKITGYSMAGTAEILEKSNQQSNEGDSKSDDGLVDRIAKKVGEILTKGVVRDYYERNKKRRNVFAAFNSLEESMYDNHQTDMEQLKEDANEFVELINEISYEELRKSREDYEEVKKEDEDMNAEEIKKLVGEAISEEVGDLKNELTKLQKEDEQTEEGAEAELTAEDIKSTVAKAVEEGLKPIQDEVDSLKKNTKKSKQLDNEENFEKQEESVFSSLFMGGNQ